MRRTVGVLVVALALGQAACSTTYQPKRRDHVYLVAKRGQIALSKNGEVVPQNEPFSHLVACDSAAREAAVSAEDNISTGMRLATIGSLLNVILGPGTAVGIFFAIEGQRRVDNGSASLIDAVNRHNDAASCRPGTRS